MDIFHTPGEMRGWSRRQSVLGKTICLVPTMGYFHEGHLTLMRLAKNRCDLVVVSHFLNPTQFGPNEDLDRYPRNFERDMDLAERQKVDAVFAPSPGQMYPEGFLTQVAVRELTRHLCGSSRPGHFDGVTTVVAKLFNIVSPDVAVFGEKDFQQLAIIRRMVRDLNFPIKIVSHAIVREVDGLAMSSRNANLAPEDRPAALSLSGALGLAREQCSRGESSAAALREKLEAYILSFPGNRVDYISFVDESTLEPMETVTERTVLALAVHIGGGKVRLIDNGFVIPRN